MHLDGEAIEKRDFPISRRGYQPAAVDAHLRAIAASVAELQQRLDAISGALATLAQGVTAGAAAGAERPRQRRRKPAAATRATAEDAAGAGEPRARAADLDGARLVALNMALNGESREQTGRCLAESFELDDAEKLIEEVYAAIEG